MANIYYHRTDEFWRREQKYDFLETRRHRARLDWRPIAPNKRYTWLTEGLQDEFEDFLPMGTRKAKSGAGNAIFELFSNGIKTNRDVWAYNFNRDELVKNIQKMIEVYNDHIYRWALLGRKPNIDDFILNDSTKISWSEGLKSALKRQTEIKFDETNLRFSFYRPFTRSHFYFDRNLNERRYQFPRIFPTTPNESENVVICVPGKGGRTNFWCFSVRFIPNLSLTSLDATQCFPFFTYDEDGSNQRENITDWALVQFRSH